MLSHSNSSSSPISVPWNKGRLTGAEAPLKAKDVWAFRVRLQLRGRKRDLALFNLAIDSKLRDCDLVRLQFNDVCAGGRHRRDALRGGGAAEGCSNSTEVDPRGN